MKLNLGIRRRLAPLLDNGRDEIELMTAILFSLPGSPILYYGDEIGMGDNVYLGDRDGVRTPMQWTGDRNGGFSRADFAQLYLPAADGPGLRLPGGQRRGPAAHANLAAALAAALHRAAQGAPGVRAGQLRAAGERATRASSPTSAGSRTTSSLCVHNLARSAQAVELDLLALRGPLPGRDVRPHPVPPHRRAAVPADAGDRAASSGSCSSKDEAIEGSGRMA